MAVKYLSIVIPTYRQRYLEDTLKSLERQNNRNFEVIVVENGYCSEATQKAVQEHRGNLDISWYFEPLHFRFAHFLTSLGKCSKLWA
ncbi:MAG: glycosyltransferase family 2 protein [SAR324 cluster bacterium]|uniref:Glycosyltransferase family 2 protein n=1 Tax=SAR324 cluster bacterium TaxID=2024889 RepID=A0A7X9ILG2_9DELT|nr:glycosyltransferase family 2 protein [SAR324 cluster bacterium]